MKILKIYARHNTPQQNYEICYGVWDAIEGDSDSIDSFSADLDSYDIVFLPMYSRWEGHLDLLNRIKDHKIKTVLFDDDSCYRSFGDEFYDGIDYIFHRGPDKDGVLPLTGSVLLWSINHLTYTPVYGGSGVSFLGSVCSAYPLRVEIDRFIKHSLLPTGEYIKTLQNSAASIHTNSVLFSSARGKVLEFAACGAQIISNRCDNMHNYFPDELIVYFDTVDQLRDIVNGFEPDVTIQKISRSIVEAKHTHEIRAEEIIEKLYRI